MAGRGPDPGVLNTGQIFLLFSFFFLRTWHKSEEMKMSWSRFILQRGFDCHVRVIDCSKDRGKSRNVITVLLRSVPPLRQSMRSKKEDIDLCAAKNCSLRPAECTGESGTDVQTCHWHL